MGTARTLPSKHSTPVASNDSEFNLESSIPYLIYRITNRLNQDIHNRLRPSRISLPRWRILGSLKSRGRATVKELASCTVMRHAVVSKVLKEMEADNLITREKCDRDQRAVIVKLTQTGRVAFEQALQIANLHRDIALKGFSPTDIQSLLKLLNQMQKNLGISAF